MIREKLLTSPPEALVWMSNLEFPGIDLGSQVIPAAILKLKGQLVEKTMEGYLLPLHLVMTWLVIDEQSWQVEEL